MKLMTPVIAMLCGLGLAVTVQATPQHEHEHHDAQREHAADAPVVPAQRFAPDESLKIGIRRTHTAVDQLKHYEMGHMSAPMAADRADEVEDAVMYMFAHCKLDAAPDAALHSILVPLLGAAKALKSDPKDVAAVAHMRAALAHYPQYFNDPGWDRPESVEHEMHDEP